jgi:hypothetical protein
VGAALVAAGLMLSFVPLLTGPSQVLTATRPDAAFNATTVGSVTQTWTIGLRWSANQTVTIEVVVCRSPNTSAGTFSALCPTGTATFSTGTAGSGTFTVPLGGVLLIGMSFPQGHVPRASIQLDPTVPLLGTLLWIGGAGIIGAVFLNRRRGQRRVPSPERSGSENAT